MSEKGLNFETAGSFETGCNYWASHAGTMMWSDWRPEVVAADLKQLSKEAGLQVLRVFPLWPDFQPINLLKGGCGFRKEMRMEEKPLPHDKLGQAGISEEMMERFAFLLDEAGKNGFRVVASLLTGWMSGRLFVPQALENLNVLSDPLALRWEIKFVKAFVERFKNRPEIAAWEFGNECNCMGALRSSDEAYLWASTIGDAIKAVDPARPLISGMHSLGVQPDAVWNSSDQAEICEVLTTHPYPRFTPHCELDPLDEMRNGLHATAESRLYADIGGKPCMVEEIGALGLTYGSEELAARYARMSMALAFAHDCRAFLWWCAYDQGELAHAPYDWNAVERELGIFHEDRTAKPLAKELREFRKQAAPLQKLPPPAIDGVCILTENQDCWGAAFASFILAKQAGFDIEFQRAGQKLKKSKLYLLPSLSSGSSPTRAQWKELLDAVKKGATLWASCGDAQIADFEKIFGLRIMRRSKRDSSFEVDMSVVGEGSTSCAAPFKLELEEAGAEVLAREEDGNPALSRFKLGAGEVFFLGFPLETNLVAKPGAFHGEETTKLWRLYKLFAKKALAGRALAKNAPELALVERPRGDAGRVAFLVNCSPKAKTFELKLNGGWRLAKTLVGGKASLSGGVLRIALKENGWSALELEKRRQ